MEPDFDIPEDILQEVMRLHASVSRRAEALSERLGSLLVCRRGCHQCCIDELAVFPVEGEIIRRHCQNILENEQPHPPGKCAFLDLDGACRIYPWRPYVCRTQGLPLRWRDEDAGEDAAEMRDICPLNADEFAGQAVELELLPKEDCWTLGEAESHLAGLQIKALGSFQETLPRVLLRDLFNFRPSRP
jgi:uncharacterized protein